MDRNEGEWLQNSSSLFSEDLTYFIECKFFGDFMDSDEQLWLKKYISRNP